MSNVNIRIPATAMNSQLMNDPGSSSQSGPYANDSPEKFGPNY